MSKVETGAVVALVVMFALSMLWWMHSRDEKEWERRVTQAVSVGDSLRRAAVVATGAADSTQVVARELGRTAIVQERAVIRHAVAVRAVPVPPACVVIAASRDSVIDEALAAADKWHHAFVTGDAAAQLLRSANVALLARGDSLDAVLRARPQSRRQWLPAPGVGVFAGVCSGGRPCVGAGVTLSWRF